MPSTASRVGRRRPGAEEAAAPAERRWSVYLLRCADGTLYAGATNDVSRRLVAHARGTVKYTRGRLPVALVHVEAVGAKGAALSREAEIKRLPRSGKERLFARRGRSR